ncbi:MAG: DUF952 domain-containing protein [Spirosomataceae bacterium]
MIYHIVSSDYWSAFDGVAEYVSETLEAEKFIHCSRREQITGVLERFFAGVPNLVVLQIDETKLTSPLLYEAVSDSDETFPHIYGPIHREAIVEAISVADFLKP